MLDILEDRYYRDYATQGFVDTGVVLPKDLVEEIRGHYAGITAGHNDFPKFFAGNEHLAYMEGRVVGAVMNAIPGLGVRMVEKFYGKVYEKAVYTSQTFIPRVLDWLLQNGIARLFRTRYLIAAYDMYLAGDHLRPAAGIHSDLPNLHHIYETENDLSFYIPLVDLDETNGGRLSVLPESKLKMPGNVLLRMLAEHFSDSVYRDGDGYLDPDDLSPQALKTFIQSKPYRELFATHKHLTWLAKNQYAADFQTTDESAGTVMLFNNKNFHAAEAWKCQTVKREIYVIRLMPLYDVPIKLKKRLHGQPINNFLLDLRQGVVKIHDTAVDVSRIAPEFKLPLYSQHGDKSSDSERLRQ